MNENNSSIVPQNQPETEIKKQENPIIGMRNNIEQSTNEHKNLDNNNANNSASESIEQGGQLNVKARLRKTHKPQLYEDKGNCFRQGMKKRKHGLGSFCRRLWNNKEDEAIDKLVKKYGDKRWTLISKQLESEFHIVGRTGKQCRER